MGGGSSAAPENIPNLQARAFYEASIQTQVAVPQNVKQSKQYRTLVRVMYDSLKHNPEVNEVFGLIITGPSVGPIFLEHFMPRISIPTALTKISLRKTSLKPESAKKIAKFLAQTPTLEEFDCSENEFGDKAQFIIEVASVHPNLHSLNLENCKVTETSLEPVTNLITLNRNYQILNIEPAKFSKAGQGKVIDALNANINLKSININDTVNQKAKKVVNRNNFVAEIVDSIIRSPFQRQFRAKIESFKSVKGREMLVGRAGQKNKVKGTALFDQMEEADLRAKTTETQEKVVNTIFRSGHSEMVGRRPSMEDVSIILEDVPTKGAMLFGLFDGHGGREAAEFASEHLPHAISERLKSTQRPEDAYIAAFKQLQMDMKPWCVYVGTTSVIAIIEGTTLTVANVGDSRCVLYRDGKAVRLSVDHKPDLPEETQYIQSKGGFVRDSRVGGMLAVSRALGDGFLGDAVNPTPSIRRVELNEFDTFMILACDGIWDVMTDQQACQVVAAEIDPLVAAKKLMDMAYELNSLDNISVIVVFLSEAFAGKLEE